MLMPRRLQALNIQNALRKKNIAPDLVDVEALIDSSLSYPENTRNILAQYGRVDNKVRKHYTKASHIGEGNVNLDLSYAAQYHQARSLHAQRTDESTRAKRTFTERQIARKPELLDMWFSHANLYDIVGIDASNGPRRTIKRKRKKRGR